MAELSEYYRMKAGILRHVELWSRPGGSGSLDLRLVSSRPIGERVPDDAFFFVPDYTMADAADHARNEFRRAG